MLWRCYLLSEPVKRGCRQSLHKTWLDNNGADVTEQRLCDQRGQIEKKGWLTSVEMEMIKRELEANVTVTNDNAVEDAVLIEAQTIDILPVLPENVSYETPSEVMSQTEAPLDDPENQLLLDRLKELLHSDEKPIFNLKKFNRYDVMAKTTAVNGILKHVTTNHITETRNLIQAASSLVGELLGAKKITTKPKKEPWWKRRIENDIELLRKDLSVIESWFSGRWKNRSKVKMDLLNRKYHLKKLGFKTAIETIKQRICSKATKVKRYNNRCQQFQQNKLFQNDQSRFYRSLEETNAENLSPNPEEATKFWSNLWSNPIEHRESTWLGEVKDLHHGSRLPKTDQAHS